MARPARPLPSALPDAFTVTQARSAGVTTGRLRGRDLGRPFRGIRMRRAGAADAPDETPLARDRAQRRRVTRLARAYLPIMAPHAFFSGRTAAVLHGLPIGHGDGLDVATLTPHRSPRRRGIRGRRFRDGLIDVQELDGLRLTTPATTWSTLGAELTVRELVILGDAIVRVPRDARGQLHPELALGTIDDLRDAIARGPRPGIGRLREAVEQVRVGSSSPLETEYRLDAAAAGLPEPALDHVVRDSLGRMLGISEFAHVAERVAVEIEGDHHRTSRAQWRRDLDKYAAYAEAGWEVVRLAANRVRDPNRSGVKRVRAALRRRGSEI